MKYPNRIDVEQGSPEWHALRKTKITATDAAVILGVSPWKTRAQLYNEKLSEETTTFANDRMQRGLALEPIARSLFTIQTGIFVEPAVLVKDWAMASLDGISEDGTQIVEIKCPGDKDHALSVIGKVPDHYYPQLQHQMYVCDLQEAYYFSFDGVDGVWLKVNRDEDYITKMIEEEQKFYQCLVNKTPPQSSETEYVERDDKEWEQFASRWKLVTDSIKSLEKEEEELRSQLVSLSGQYNTKGAGVSLCQIQRRGSVDYSKIPELKSIDLEVYRKSSITSWRLTSS
jgi:putative phage-type endonuclease